MIEIDRERLTDIDRQTVRDGQRQIDRDGQRGRQRQIEVDRGKQRQIEVDKGQRQIDRERQIDRQMYIAPSFVSVPNKNFKISPSFASPNKFQHVLKCFYYLLQELEAKDRQIDIDRFLLHHLLCQYQMKISKFNHLLQVQTSFNIKCSY